MSEAFISDSVIWFSAFHVDSEKSAIINKIKNQWVIPSIFVPVPDNSFVYAVYKHKSLAIKNTVWKVSFWLKNSILFCTKPVIKLQGFFGSREFFNTTVSNTHGPEDSKHRLMFRLIWYFLSTFTSYTLYLLKISNLHHLSYKLSILLIHQIKFFNMIIFQNKQ